MDETATRLLRALVDEAMERRQVDDEKDVIGATVMVTTSATNAAEIPADRTYEATLSGAVNELLHEGALVRNEEASQALSGVMGNPEAYKITSTGIALLG